MQAIDDDNVTVEVNYEEVRLLLDALDAFWRHHRTDQEKLFRLYIKLYVVSREKWGIPH